MQSWDSGSLVPLFSKELSSTGRVPSAVPGAARTETPALKQPAGHENHLLQGFGAMFSTRANKALQNPKSFPGSHIPHAGVTPDF